MPFRVPCSGVQTAGHPASLGCIPPSQHHSRFLPPVRSDLLTAGWPMTMKLEMGAFVDGVAVRCSQRQEQGWGWGGAPPAGICKVQRACLLMAVAHGEAAGGAHAGRDGGLAAKQKTVQPAADTAVVGLKQQNHSGVRSGGRCTTWWDSEQSNARMVGVRGGAPAAWHPRPAMKAAGVEQRQGASNPSGGSTPTTEAAPAAPPARARPSLPLPPLPPPWPVPRPPLETCPPGQRHPGWEWQSQRPAWRRH